MTSGGIDLLASWQCHYGKHSNHMHLEGNFLLPHMVYLEGKDRKVFWRSWKVNFMSEVHIFQIIIGVAFSFWTVFLFEFIWVARSLLFYTILVGASLVYFTYTWVAPLFHFLTNVLLIINYTSISFLIWFDFVVVKIGRSLMIKKSLVTWMDEVEEII